MSGPDACVDSSSGSKRNGSSSALGKEVYLDHAGATLPPPEMMEMITRDMMMSTYGNPHSRSAVGLRTEEVIQRARAHIYDLLGASPHQYDVAFTSGATAACKMVAEMFPFGADGVFCYPMNVHTSVLGMRCFSRNCAVIPSEAQWSPAHRVNCTLTDVGNDEKLSADGIFNLLAVTGECNFTGMQADLGLVPSLLKNLCTGHQPVSSISQSESGEYLQELLSVHPWMWLLDASKLAATSEINLRSLSYADRPAFVCLSMYKIFGYPTGLGCLLIRRDAAAKLTKRLQLLCMFTIDRNVPLSMQIFWRWHCFGNSS
jgi:molybdenum cofactor sulfurtransferase